MNNFYILNRFNLVYLVDLELVYVNFIILEEWLLDDSVEEVLVNIY